MPKVIRSRKLIPAGAVEIPDHTLPEPAEVCGSAAEEAELPNTPAVPLPAMEQSQLAAEEALRKRLDQLRLQAEETAGKILRHAGEERERILQEARAEAEEICQQSQQEGYQAAFEEKQSQIENMLGSVEGLLNQLALQQRQYFTRYEKALPDLALEIAEKVMENTVRADPLVLEPLVQRAVAQVKNAEWLEVQVSRQLPELAQELRKELRHWTEARHVEATGDQEEWGSCIVHTPQGIIDASVSTQLENLKKRLHTSAQG